MRRGQLAIIVPLMLATILALAGCAPRAAAVERAASTDPSQIVIDLPAIVLDVQSDGSLALASGGLDALNSVIGPQLAAVKLSPAWVASLTAGNIQHIQIDNTPEGLAILVNGKAIPSLAWDGERLVSTAEALGQIGPGVALLDKVLPLLTNLGIGVILRLPVAAGAEEIPYMAADDGSAEAAARAQADFLATVGEPPVIDLTVTFAEDGSWSVGGLNGAALEAMLGPTIESIKSQVLTLRARGISNLSIASNPDGVFISINGKDLPYLAWGEGRVGNLIHLAADAGLLDDVLPAGSDVDGIVQQVESLLPQIQSTNFNIVLDLP
jgi:hypothetical protein